LSPDTGRHAAEPFDADARRIVAAHPQEACAPVPAAGAAAALACERRRGFPRAGTGDAGNDRSAAGPLVQCADRAPASAPVRAWPDQPATVDAGRPEALIVEGERPALRGRARALARSVAAARPQIAPSRRKKRRQWSVSTMKASRTSPTNVP